MPAPRPVNQMKGVFHPAVSSNKPGQRNHHDEGKRPRDFADGQVKPAPLVRHVVADERLDGRDEQVVAQITQQDRNKESDNMRKETGRQCA